VPSSGGRAVAPRTVVTKLGSTGTRGVGNRNGPGSGAGIISPPPSLLTAIAMALYAVGASAIAALLAAGAYGLAWAVNDRVESTSRFDAWPAVGPRVRRASTVASTVARIA